MKSQNPLIFNFCLEKAYCGHQKEKFIYSLEFLESPPIVISGGNDKKLRAWNLETLSDSQIFDLSSEIGVIKKFESNIVLAGTRDGEIYFFKHTNAGKIFFHFSQKLHSEWICSIDFDVKTKQVLSGANDSKIKLWGLDPDYSQLSFLKEISTNGGFVRNAQLVDSELIFYVNWTNTAKFINKESCTDVKNIEGEQIFTSAYLRPDKKFLLLGSADGKLSVYSW